MVSRGSFHEIPLRDVITELFHNCRTGKLRVSGNNEQGEIVMKSGNIVDVHFGSRRREEAFYAMLELQEGEYEFEEG